MWGGTVLTILVYVELFLFGIYYGVINNSLWRLHLQYNYPIESQKFAVDVVSIIYNLERKAKRHEISRK